MSRAFRHGERVKIVRGKAAGHEGTVVCYDHSSGLLHLTLDRKLTLNIGGHDRLINKVGVKELDLESLESHDPQEVYHPVPDELELPKPSEPVVLTLYEAFNQDREARKPKYQGQAAKWKTEGLCPNCGEKGRISHGSFVCTRHGIY